MTAWSECPDCGSSDVMDDGRGSWFCNDCPWEEIPRPQPTPDPPPPPPVTGLDRVRAAVRRAGPMVPPEDVPDAIRQLNTASCCSPPASTDGGEQ